MGEPWIRVHANLRSKPVIFRAVEALGVSRAEAVGLLVTFWGEASQHAPNGRVGDYPDAQLEAWAGWQRKRGRFAAFIRSHHLDAAGRVNEWDEYAGMLEEQRRQARDRKRKSRGSHSDGHGDNGVTSSPTRRYETIRDVEPSSAAAAETEAALAVMLESDADRVALTAVVARANNRGTCLTALHAILTGNDPSVPKPSPRVFGRALRDLAMNDAPPSARVVRSYMETAAREELDPPPPGGSPRRNGRGPSGINPGAQQVANILGTAGGRRD